MQLDSEKLKKLIESETDLLEVFCSSSFFIGEVDNKPIMVSVMTQREAIETHDYVGLESIPKSLICIKE